MKKFFVKVGATIGYIFGLVGTLIGILTVSGQIKIGIRWIVIAAFIFISSIVITIMATLRYLKVIKNGTRFEISAYGQEKGKDLYYTEYSSNLRVGTLVSIYYTEPISKILGYGIVQNCSADEYVEIMVTHVEDDFKTIFTQSKTNTNKVLRHMYILPNVYVEQLPEITNYLNGGKTKNE